jgi:hypothetical protein
MQRRRAAKVDGVDVSLLLEQQANDPFIFLKRVFVPMRFIAKCNGVLPSLS